MIQNITIRVPWSDNGWCGKVCNHPCTNTDCLRLKNIYENKNEVEEEKIAGKPLKGIEKQVPYSLPARPFLWTMKRGKDFEKYDIDYQASREPQLDFENAWVQDAPRLPETHSFCRSADGLEIMDYL